MAGCADESQSDAGRDSPLPTCELEIYDSLVIRSSSLLFLSDYLPERRWYLLYDYFKGDILIVDRSGKTVNRFSRKGGGNQEYGDIRGLSFHGPDKVIAFGMARYFIYSVEGDFVEAADIAGKAVLVNPIYDFKALHFFDADSTLQLLVKGSSGNYGSPLRPEFYTGMKWAAVYDTGEGRLWEGVTYESGSPYIHRYLGQVSPQFALDKEQQQLLVLFPFDPVLYQYQLPGLNLTTTIDLEPSFFPPNKGVVFSNDVEKMKEESMRHMQLSGRYLSVQSLGDGRFLTAYTAQLPEALLVKDRSAYIEGGLQDYRDKYLQLFAGQEKICRDIPLPENVKALGIATALDHIVLLARTPEEQTLTKYYLAQMVGEEL